MLFIKLVYWDGIWIRVSKQTLGDLEQGPKYFHWARKTPFNNFFRLLSGTN